MLTSPRLDTRLPNRATPQMPGWMQVPRSCHRLRQIRLPAPPGRRVVASAAASSWAPRPACRATYDPVSEVTACEAGEKRDACRRSVAAGRRSAAGQAMNRRTVASLLLTTGNLLATFVLIDLRLASVIDWAWWWIVAPLWLPITISVLAFAVLAVVERLR